MKFDLGRILFGPNGPLVSQNTPNGPRPFTVGEIFLTALETPSVLDTVAHIQFDLYERISNHPDGIKRSNQPSIIDLTRSEAMLIGQLCAVAFADRDRINPMVVGTIQKMIDQAMIEAARPLSEMSETTNQPVAEFEND